MAANPTCWPKINKTVKQRFLYILHPVLHCGSIVVKVPKALILIFLFKFYTNIFSILARCLRLKNIYSFEFYISQHYLNIVNTPNCFLKFSEFFLVLETVLYSSHETCLKQVFYGGSLVHFDLHIV